MEAHLHVFDEVWKQIQPRIETGEVKK